MASSSLTHLDEAGRAHMVDISEKAVTSRQATAEGRVIMSEVAFCLAEQGAAEKGEVKRIAELAGIMAAKRTSDLVPLCHPLPLSSVQVRVQPDPDPGPNVWAMRVTATCKTLGRTGVEMEALTAVSAACLTVYDMLKAVDRAMQITGIEVNEKSGGASGDWKRGGDR